MNNFALCFDNYPFVYPDDTVAVVAGTVTGGSIDNLRKTQLSDGVTIESAELEDPGTATVTIKWTAEGAPDITRLVQHIAALQYVLTATDATSVALNAVVYGPASYEETFPIELITSPRGWFPPHAHLQLDAAVEAYEVRLVFTAVFGAGGGQLIVQLGAMWVSEVWCPVSGIDKVWRTIDVPNGTMSVSPGGQGYPRRRPMYRRSISKSLHVNEINALGDPDDPLLLDIQAMRRTVGNTEMVIVFPRTLKAGVRSPHLMFRLGVYGHFEQLGDLEHIAGDKYTWHESIVRELF